MPLKRPAKRVLPSQVRAKNVRSDQMKNVRLREQRIRVGKKSLGSK